MKESFTLYLHSAALRRLCNAENMQADCPFERWLFRISKRCEMGDFIQTVRLKENRSDCAFKRTTRTLRTRASAKVRDGRFYSDVLLYGDIITYISDISQFHFANFYDKIKEKTEVEVK